MRSGDDFNLSSTAMDNAYAAMAMHVGRIGPDRNGNWFEFFADGSTNGCRYGPCHGSLRGKDTHLIATMSPWGRVRYQSYVSSYSGGGYKDPLGVGLLTRWYDYFVNRSWASEYVVAPSVEFARDVGLVVPSSIPANYALAIFAMSRIAGENAHNVARMFDYVDEFGISEDLAFFLSHGVATSNKYGSLIHGHSLFRSDHGPAALAIWMSRKFRQTNKSLTSGDSTQGVNAMFGPGERVSLVDAWSVYKDKVEAGRVVIPNPFKPVVNKGTGVMTEDFLRSIIPNLKEKFDAPQFADTAAANPRAMRRAA